MQQAEVWEARRSESTPVSKGRQMLKLSLQFEYEA
jgi:hypothetical protein